MSQLRAALILAVTAATGTAAARVARVEPAAARSPAPDQSPDRSPDLVTPTMIVARLANTFDVQLVPHGFVEHLVRWRLGLRDLAHGALSRLAAFAEHATVVLPDLSVLAIQPVALGASTWATSGYGWREDPIRRRRKFHRGADIRARPGTPVMAAGDGVVTFAARQGGYGNVIYVDHGGGVITRYAHLRRIEVKRDAAITAGQRIGQVGSTGRATGPHLHFEVRLDGRAVDPWTALAVGELVREVPAVGVVAGYALTPELQEHATSELDPPRTRTRKRRTHRPERPGRIKRPRPVS